MRALHSLPAGDDGRGAAVEKVLLAPGFAEKLGRSPYSFFFLMCLFFAFRDRKAHKIIACGEKSRKDSLELVNHKC